MLAGLLIAPLTVHADPAVGLGLSFAFGGGQQMQTGIGLRVFSDDEEESFVASAGVDYMFNGGWRGTVGGAYLGDDAYLGLDLGLDFNGGGMTFGPSFGGVNTEEDAAAAPPPPPPPAV